MDIKDAVFATQNYAQFFGFPLTKEEVCYWLISPNKVSLKEVEPYTPNCLTKKDVQFRRKLNLYTAQKLTHARKLVKLLRYIPGLHLVAVTGSVAAKNAKSKDDIDLFLITAPHTLWIVRPLVILLISIFFRRRHPGENHDSAANAFCPNLWIDELSLLIPSHRQNLYTAHEVLQIIPILDKNDAYQKFIQANIWTQKHLANAFASVSRGGNYFPIKTSPLMYLFIPLNIICFFAQLLYMIPKRTTEIVNLHRAYLHTTDFNSQINKYLKTKLDI